MPQLRPCRRSLAAISPQRAPATPPTGAPEASPARPFANPVTKHATPVRMPALALSARAISCAGMVPPSLTRSRARGASTLALELGLSLSPPHPNPLSRTHTHTLSLSRSVSLPPTPRPHPLSHTHERRVPPALEVGKPSTGPAYGVANALLAAAHLKELRDIAEQRLDF